jgi:hypothetical protein
MVLRWKIRQIKLFEFILLSISAFHKFPDQINKNNQTTFRIIFIFYQNILIAIVIKFLNLD